MHTRLRYNRSYKTVIIIHSNAYINTWYARSMCTPYVINLWIFFLFQIWQYKINCYKEYVCFLFIVVTIIFELGNGYAGIDLWLKPRYSTIVIKYKCIPLYFDYFKFLNTYRFKSIIIWWFIFKYKGRSFLTCFCIVVMFWRVCLHRHITNKLQKNRS